MTILVTILIPIFSGLILFSIKYKKAFDMLFFKIVGIVLFIFFVLNTYSLGVSSAWNISKKYIDKKALEEAELNMPTLPFNGQELLVIFIIILLVLTGINIISNTIYQTKEKSSE